MNFSFPSEIKRLIGERTFETDGIGRSDSTVLVFEDMVLKIEEPTEGVLSSVKMMKWLEGKIPVPHILHHEVFDGKSYLLMTKVSGKMACDEYYMTRQDELCDILAKTLKFLWSVDVSDCPKEETLDYELSLARKNVEQGKVDINDCEPETFGEGGFKDPYDLLLWLESNRPDYDPVLSHGDFCLPNVFIENGKLSGLIDLGNTSVSDRYRDISLCYRSLKHNADGTFGAIYPEFDPETLFEKLGIEIDREKLRYYILLDELF